MPCGSSKDSCHQDENGHCGFEDLDHSVLQQPLNLGVTNVKQILKCIQSGSREVKDIVLNECNIIYECKACLGLFRSLANFMYHKRCYCKKHLCEEMVLFENFEEAEPIVIQPEAPPETIEVPMETSTEAKLIDCTVHLVKTDIAQKINSGQKGENSKSETVGSPKEKTVAPNSEKVKGKSELPQKTESSMISRRTRDKNAQNSSKIALKAISSEEPPVKCAKIISAKLMKKDSSEKTTSTGTRKDNQPVTVNKEAKAKNIEISKFASTLDKSVPSFPKIIFKSIDSNPHAVFQSNDKKKFDSFVNRYETHEAKVVDNEKLIIVLKKDVKPENEVFSKPSESNKSEMEKLSDFHLTRRKRLMSRNDCNVHELKCLTCKTQFMSLKTLYFHMLSLHSKKRLYYPCPFCKTLFVQMYGVTRHLISIHNKTKEQINKLRDIIKKKSVWKRIDDVNPSNDMNVSPVNYQIKTDIQPEVQVETPKAVDSESGEADSLKTVIRFGKNVTLHQCAKCNRVFGRKSSQVSHQKFCIMNASVKMEVTDATPVSQQTSPPVVSFLSLPQKAPASPLKSSSVFQINKSENTQVNRASELKESQSNIKISIRPKRGAEKQMHKDFVNSQTLKWRSANRVDTNINSKAPSPIKKTNGKNLEKKVLSIMDPETLTCLKCDKKFSSYSNLRRHVAIHVGWTRFKCKYCDYQAYNKSQCWAHIQKAHSVDDDDMEKSIVNLANSNSAVSCKKSPCHNTPSSSKRTTEVSVKSSNSKGNALAKVKGSKKKSVNSPKNDGSEKKQIQTPTKKELPEVKNEVENESEKETTEIKKEKSQPPIPVAKIPKKDIVDAKKEKTQTTISVQKFPKKEVLESKKEKPQATISIQKFPKKEMLENKKEKHQATISIQKFPKKEMLENKKEKPQHIIPIQKLSLPDYKRDTNYKSVTTSNPTTIILSKKIPSSTVQSIVTISSDSMSSPSKISPIRTSPRKNDIKGSEEKLITTLVSRASPNTKIMPIQIKLPARSNSVEESSQDSTEKNCSKKERLISEWFPKKDLSSSTIRRDSAPLIIGLVPATNAGVNARAKNSAVPFEKN